MSLSLQLWSPTLAVADGRPDPAGDGLLLTTRASGVGLGSHTQVVTACAHTEISATAALGDTGSVLGTQLADLARVHFLDGFTTGTLVAGVITAVAGILTIVFLPAHPGDDDST